MNTFAIATLLILFIAIAGPIWDLIESRRLRANPTLAARSAYYWRVIAIEWPLALLVIGLSGRRILTFVADPSISWIPKSDTLLGAAASLTVGILLTPLLMRRPALQPFFRKQLVAATYLVPRSTAQKWLFVLVSLTAGVCEEIIFRGFALSYALDFIPHPPLAVAIGMTALLFGIIHVGQGAAGVLATGVLGLLLAIAFVATGSLAIPIAVHFLLDVRFALIPDALLPEAAEA